MHPHCEGMISPFHKGCGPVEEDRPSVSWVPASLGIDQPLSVCMDLLLSSLEKEPRLFPSRRAFLLQASPHMLQALCLQAANQFPSLDLDLRVPSV